MTLIHGIFLYNVAVSPILISPLQAGSVLSNSARWGSLLFGRVLVGVWGINSFTSVNPLFQANKTYWLLGSVPIYIKISLLAMINVLLHLLSNFL